MRKCGFACGTAFLILLAGAASAQPQGNATAGREIATKWCSRCHDIAPGGAFKQQPPAFAAIAVYRSPEQIRATIVAPAMHSGMPELVQILGLNAADLTAYIESLEGTAPR
jgi:mono/diheme cytochrome c family protein